MATDRINEQPKQTTAYLGPEASFSHQAAVEALPHTNPRPLPSFGAILKSLQEDGSKATGIDYAVLPVENSTNGSVVQALDLLAKCGLDPEISMYQDVEVIDEHYLEVHHCLFVSRIWAQQHLDAEILERLERGNALHNQETAIQDSNMESNGGSSRLQSNDLEGIIIKLNIKTIYSHPQVWGQCNNILSTLLPAGHVDRVDMSSTSAAASFVANSSHLSNTTVLPSTTQSSQNGRRASIADSGGLAAISSSLAGQKYNKDLICIARNIEDDPGSNTTRFFVLCNRNRKSAIPSIPRNGSDSDVSIKSLLAFTTIHDIPGSLAQALAVFAQCGFNLTAIQSRPRPKPKSKTAKTGNPDMDVQSDSSVREKTCRPQDSNWKYVFFVECLHVRSTQDTGGTDVKVERLLAELENVTERLVLLGSWQDRLSI